jgi:hypothetical protein
MSRKLAVVSLAMLILVGAMGLKTIVTAHGDGSVIMANGAAPAPPTPYRNGAAPRRHRRRRIETAQHRHHRHPIDSRAVSAAVDIAFCGAGVRGVGR